MLSHFRWLQAYFLFRANEALFEVIKYLPSQHFQSCYVSVYQLVYQFVRQFVIPMVFVSGL